MSYLEVAVSAVPTANKDRYIQEAGEAAAAFMAHGAIAVTENWGDTIPKGERTDFHKAVQRQENETIVVSTILWPSKDARDAGWPKVMEDPAMQGHGDLFDMSRMIFGSFETIVDKR
ncbi:MAG: DUF1428 domain-containing protein [Pseudomonadota bacterium]